MIVLCVITVIFDAPVLRSLDAELDGGLVHVGACSGFGRKVRIQA